MKALHLVGSTLNDFYFNLSYVYYQNVFRSSDFSHVALLRFPNGDWKLEHGESDRTDIQFEDIYQIASEFDIIVPHMFCPQGMTSYRGYFEDVVGVPVVGPSSRSNTLTLSKWDTKSLATAAGVRCPRAVRMTEFDSTAPLGVPCIVKPDTEDNSIGVTLVRVAEDFPAALKKALSFAPVAVVEEYIDGREIRIGVVEVASQAQALPPIEYHVTKDRPIRTLRDKLDVSDDGEIAETRWEEPTIPSSCPADVAPDLYKRMSDAALTLHHALSSRDYSLYDFRVDSDGTPYLLESCPFWTFSSRSILSMMIQADGSLDLESIIGDIWRKTAARKGQVEEQKHAFLAS
ncbi:MAG: D-alanine--D-alanine ligase [Pseudomonadota bacterium]